MNPRSFHLSSQALSLWPVNPLTAYFCSLQVGLLRLLINLEELALAPGSWSGDDLSSTFKYLSDVYCRVSDWEKGPFLLPFTPARPLPS